MSSKGTEIFCTECGKRWNLNEDGTLTALSGETEFSHVPDWFEWERSEVRKQVEETLEEADGLISEELNEVSMEPIVPEVDNGDEEDSTIKNIKRQNIILKIICGRQTKRRTRY